MDAQPKSNWFVRNWMWAVPVGCLAPIVMFAGFFGILATIVFGALKSSDAYTKSLAAVSSDTRVQTAIGTPIKPGFLVSGNINVNGSTASGGTGHADISYSLSGPKGEAGVHAVADKSAGRWTFQTIAIDVKATGEHIDIQPQP